MIVRFSSLWFLGFSIRVLDECGRWSKSSRHMFKNDRCYESAKMPRFSSSQTWGFPLMSCALECQPPWRVASCGLGLLGITMWQPLWATCIELHWVRSWTSKKQKRQSPEIQLCNFLNLSIRGFKLKTLYPGVGKSAIRALCTVSIFAEVAVKRSTPLFLANSRCSEGLSCTPCCDLQIQFGDSLRCRRIPTFASRWSSIFWDPTGRSRIRWNLTHWQSAWHQAAEVMYSCAFRWLKQRLFVSTQSSCTVPASLVLFAACITSEKSADFASDAEIHPFFV